MARDAILSGVAGFRVPGSSALPCNTLAAPEWQNSDMDQAPETWREARDHSGHREGCILQHLGWGSRAASWGFSSPRGCGSGLGILRNLFLFSRQKPKWQISVVDCSKANKRHWWCPKLCWIGLLVCWSHVYCVDSVSKRSSFCLLPWCCCVFWGRFRLGNAFHVPYVQQPSMNSAAFSRGAQTMSWILCAEGCRCRCNSSPRLR